MWQCLLTEPAPSKTPFGDTNIPEPMIDPTMIPTPLKRVILLFSLTASSVSISTLGSSPFGVRCFTSVMSLPPVLAVLQIRLGLHIVND